VRLINERYSIKLKNRYIEIEKIENLTITQCLIPLLGALPEHVGGVRGGLKETNEQQNNSI
jgi:hypothetical protein